MRTTVLVISVLMTVGGVLTVVAAVIGAERHYRSLKTKAQRATHVAALLCWITAPLIAMFGLPSGHSHYPTTDGFHFEKLAAVVSLMAFGAGWVALWLAAMIAQLRAWSRSDQRLPVLRRLITAIVIIVALPAGLCGWGLLFEHWYPWNVYLRWARGPITIVVMCVVFVVVVAAYLSTWKRKNAAT